MMIKRYELADSAARPRAAHGTCAAQRVGAYREQILKVMPTLLAAHLIIVHDRISAYAAFALKMAVLHPLLWNLGTGAAVVTVYASDVSAARPVGRNRRERIPPCQQV